MEQQLELYMLRHREGRVPFLKFYYSRENTQNLLNLLLRNGYEWPNTAVNNLLK